mmetsp:Transcript_2212/g.8667  ORF Transcript_2212/g.8667 Transcript_2212/m.8667 type:complete len:370 (-) Transcript_2212:28-1137(-)
MRVEVDESHDDKGRLPRQAEAGDDADDAFGESRNQTVRVQVTRHGDERGEPHERIPSRTFGKTFFPGDDTGDEEDGQAVERGGDRADAELGTKDPETHGQRQGSSHDLFVNRHRTELRELFLRLDRSVWRVLDFRRIQDVEDERRGDEADDTRHESTDGPLSPGDGDARDGRRQVHAKRVSGHGGDEHTGRDRRGLEHGGHDVRAHLLLRAVGGIGAARDAERLGEGQEDTTRACGQRRNGWREQSFGEHQGVGQTERGFAEQAHDFVRDAVAQTRLDEPAGEEERERNQPRNLARERRECSRERQQPGRHAHAEPDHRHRAERQRVRDDPDDRRHENREQVPRLRRHPRRGRNEVQDQPRQNRVPERL